MVLIFTGRTLFQQAKSADCVEVRSYIAGGRWVGCVREGGSQLSTPTVTISFQGNVQNE